VKAPRALRGTHASRRSTCGVYNLGTALPGPDGHSHATLSRQVSPPFIRTRPAIEGSPHSRADGDPRRPGAVFASNTSRRRHTLLHQLVCKVLQHCLHELERRPPLLVIAAKGLALVLVKATDETRALCGSRSRPVLDYVRFGSILLKKSKLR